MASERGKARKVVIEEVKEGWYGRSGWGKGKEGGRKGKERRGYEIKGEEKEKKGRKGIEGGGKGKTGRKRERRGEEKGCDGKDRT